MDRLIGDQVNDNDSLSFDYDLNHNRLSQTNDQLSQQLNYSPATNRISDTSTVSNDLTPRPEEQQRLFNDANRFYQLIEDGQIKAEYIYNDLGPRTRKTLFDD